MSNLYSILFFLLFLPLFLVGQSTKFPTKADLTKIYTQAIKDFIKEANKKTNSDFDTLFFGKHKNGDPQNDFPEIELAPTIENTVIKLISPELGAKIQHERKSSIYINLMGWVEKEKAEFIFIVFSNGFEHQYDCYIHYKYNATRKKFDLMNSYFKFPPFSN